MEEKNRNITALGAKAPKTKKIIFISEVHEKFYYPIYPSSDKQEKEEKHKAGEMDRLEDDTKTYLQLFKKH